MTINLGIVKPGSTIFAPFHTFSSDDPSASMTITGLAVTDIEIYKNGSTTQRSSDSGYTLLDTDGIDFDGTTGIHGVSIDLSDNTDSGFYVCGAKYMVVVASITLDAGTINFIPVVFEIGYPNAIINTTIATLASQTSFTLTAGPAEDDALNGMWVIIHDIASAVQLGYGIISDYTGATKTITLSAGTTFTAAAGDNISIMGPMPLQPTTAGRSLDIQSTGEADANLTMVGGVAQSATDLKDFADTGYDPSTHKVQGVVLVDTTTTNTDMRGTDSAALASVLGALDDAAAAGDPTSADTIMQYAKQLINILVGTAGIGTFPAEAAPANAVSLAEVIRAIHADVTGLNGDAMRGTDSAALASVCTETRLAELDAANIPADIDELTTQGDTNESKIDTLDTVADGIAAKMPTNYCMGSSDQADHDGDFITTAAIKTAMEASGSDLDYLVKALVNKAIWTEANGNLEMFSDADVSLGSVAAQISTDSTYTTRKRAVI